MSWLWVAIGGALGSTARYGVARLWPATPGGFPVPTITVNLVGSFAIGLLYIWIATRAGGHFATLRHASPISMPASS